MAALNEQRYSCSNCALPMSSPYRATYSSMLSLICSALSAPVSSMLSASANHFGLAFAISNMALAWLRPRGVVMNAAQPLFSSTMGRMYPHDDGLAKANSENVTPATPAPTRPSYRSDPMSCHVDPFL